MYRVKVNSWDFAFRQSHFDILQVQIYPSVQNLVPWPRKVSGTIFIGKNINVLRNGVEIGIWEPTIWTHQPKISLFRCITCQIPYNGSKFSSKCSLWSQIPW